MTSVIVPPVDLAPGMPSRVVTISATDVTEGGQSMAGQMVRFALSDTLDVTSGGDVIAKTQAEVVLDAQGNGSIRLPVYSDAVKTWCGDPDWAILVTATWGSQKAVRVPAGTSSIALSSLPPVRPLRGREKQWAVTGASVSVTQGAQWDIDVSLSGGVLDFDFTVPPGATAFWRGTLAAGDDLNDLTQPGGYSFGATNLNRPSGSGTVIVSEGRNTAGAVTVTNQIVFTPGISSAGIYQRFKGSGGWSAWQWSGGSDSARVQQIPSGGDLNDARTPGSYGFWGNLSDNAPTAGSGTLYVSEVLTTSGAVSALSQFAVMPHVSGPQLWSRFFGSAWSQWIRIDAGAVVPTEIGMRPAAPGSMKSAPLAMSTGFGGAQTTGTGTTVIVQYMPEMVERVQLHLINRNPRYQLLDESTTTLSSVQIGLHNGSGGSTAWTTLGTGATPYGSPWINVPAAWRGKDVAVRYTWANSGTIQMNIGYGWTNGARQGNLPLWAWLECEVPADTPVVGVYGDSLSSGVGSSRSMADSYIVQWAKLHGAFPAFWAHSGDASTTWTETTPRKWFLYGMDVAAPDAMIYAMGSNEVFGGASPDLATMKQRVTDTVAMIRKKITPNVYGALIMPRTSYPDETLRRAVNSWYPTSGLFRQVIDFASAVSTDDDNIIPAYDSDGIHLTTAGYAAVAAVIPASIIPAPASWDAAIAALTAAAS